jgi:hypothetical protein
MARASRAFGNSQQIQINIKLSAARNVSRLGLPRRKNIDLLPKHVDFCLERRPRSNQIDSKTEYQSDEAQHPGAASTDSLGPASRISLRQGYLTDACP